MAGRTGRPKESLADASRGRRLVAWETVDAYVLACGGSPHEWYDKYRRAQRSLERAAEPEGTSLLVLTAATILSLAAAIGSWALLPAEPRVSGGGQRVACPEPLACVRPDPVDASRWRTEARIRSRARSHPPVRIEGSAGSTSTGTSTTRT
jgi:hypothetical protein